MTLKLANKHGYLLGRRGDVIKFESGFKRSLSVVSNDSIVLGERKTARFTARFSVSAEDFKVFAFVGDMGIKFNMI